MALSPRPRSIEDFCSRHGICRSTFYNHAKLGSMPAVTKIGARTIILEADEKAWVQTRSANADSPLEAA
jgi:predicted DNA-binding transcriptional regulator AlpA